MNAQDRIVQFVRNLLERAPEGLLLDRLDIEVARVLGRPIARRVLEELLVRSPGEFSSDAAGRWRLRTRPGTVESENLERPARVPLERGRFVVFDLETLGRDAHADDTEIIEIAFARYEGGRLVETWQTFVQPGTAIPPQLTALTSIRDQDVADAPGQRAAIEDFLLRVAGYPLIAHNGSTFDQPVLRNVAHRVGASVPDDLVVLDTLPLARFFHQLPGQRHTNEDLAVLYGCHLPDAHRAAADVAMLGGVVEGLLREPNHHPLGPLLYELLARCGDPWGDLLDPPSAGLDLSACLLLLGQARLPLVQARGHPDMTGADEAAIEAVFDEMVRRGRDRREPQVHLATLAGQAFRSGNVVAVEAGTGIGKSLGYLVPAALHARAAGQPVVVSTHTKVLQDQLVEKDLAFLAEVVPGLTSTVLKGRANYLSLGLLADELADAIDEPSLSRARAWTLGTLASFALHSQDGDLEGLWLTIRAIEDLYAGQGEAVTLLNSLRASAEGAATRPPGGGLDFYAAARENARRADVVVVNHSLLFSQARPFLAVGNLPELMSPYVVCDEAHNLEDAATNVLKLQVEERTLRRLVRAIHHRPRRSGLLPALRRSGILLGEAIDQAARAADEAVEHIDNLSERLHDFIDANTIISQEDRSRYGSRVEIRPTVLRGAGGPALGEAAWALVEAIARLRVALTAIAERCDEAGTRRATRSARLARSLIFDFVDAEQTLRWFWSFAEATAYVRVIATEPEPEAGANLLRPDERPLWSIEGLPIDVSATLHANLWSRLDAALFCSATLATHGDSFGYFLRRSGLDRLGPGRLATEILPNVFDYRSQALLMLPNHLPAPRDFALKRAFPEATANELRRFIPYFHGRTLGLFTATARMRFVYDRIAAPLYALGFPLLRQGDGASARLRVEFETNEETSLFGVRSFWEGIDVPGRSLSFVFMSKLPFPSLGDPLESARLAAVERSGGNSFYDYFLPKTIFTFKQGFGRLIRTKDDHGAVILLDKRLRGATYRPDVLQSLPGPTVGYESDLEMYRRLCEWMGEPFDTSLLTPFPIGDAERAIADHTLPKLTFTPEEFETEALPRLRAALNAIWGFPDFRPDQLAIIRAVLTGNDVLALLPTGAGKSLTFQLPALLRPGQTIVISPLIALIRDQIQKLRDEADIRFVNCLISGMSSMEQEEALVDARDGRIRLLYVSPERLRDPRFRAVLPELPIVQLVVDEAHCISTWGHDFRPDFLEIVPQLPAASRIPVQTLTATATDQVQSDIRATLQLGAHGFPLFTHIGDFRRPNLVFRVFRPASVGARDQLALGIVKQIIADPEKGGSGIVYVATRREAERLARLLRSLNIAAQPYHAGLATATRHHIQELFMQGELQVVVATNAFGMGVDKQEIRFVLHFDHPSSVEAYIQEAGRAGRDGREAYAILLYLPATKRTLDFLARANLPTREGLRRVASTILNGNPAGSLRLPNGATLSSFEALASEIGTDLAPARVMLFALEHESILERGNDFTLAATILLNNAPAEIAGRLDGDDRALFDHLAEYLEFAPDRRVVYNALPFAAATGRHPTEVDALLYRLARSGDLLFRGFDRGVTLSVGPRANDPTAIDDAATTFLDRLHLYRARLDRIVDYATLSSDSGLCRAAFLVNYLTGAARSGPCGKCDLCAPHHPVPFSPTSLAAPEALPVEPVMAILEVVRDHDGIFGPATLVKILLGQTAGVSSDGPYRISAYARASTHFGALRGHSNGEELRALFDRLLAGGQLVLVERARPGGETYRALRLTNLGRDVLRGAAPLPGNGEVAMVTARVS